MNTSTSFSTTKLIAIVIRAAVVVGGRSFNGGMKYAQSNPPTGGQARLSQAGFSEFAKSFS